MRKYIMAEQFITALTEAGLLPFNCTSVSITARVGEAVEMDYSIIGDERLLYIAEAIKEAASREEAGVVR